MKQNRLKDTCVTGFALFAMFFGAGNLIFPPYLGWSGASNWFLGFCAYIFADVGLSLIALLVVSRLGGAPFALGQRLGRIPAAILVSAAGICTGPLIAVPRTAATTFEFAIQPIFPHVSSWLFSIAFFTLVILLCIRQSKVIDIIGSIMAPVLLAVLTVLIIRGIVSPLGVVHGETASATVIHDGIRDGYQTMDMLGAMLFAMAITTSITQKGYRAENSRQKIIARAGLLSAVCLFAVYGGLAYLGATVSSVYPSNMERAELLIAITSGLLGKSGVVLLGVVVAFACLTTAVGLITSTATLFRQLSGERIGYTLLVVLLSAASCLISNVGINQIIAFAAPILDVIYPVLVVLVVLNISKKHIPGSMVFHFSAWGTLAVSLLTLAENHLPAELGMHRLPLSDMGFGWVLPALALGLLGAVIDRLLQARIPTMKRAEESE